MFGTGRQERRLLRKFPRPLGEGRVRVIFLQILITLLRDVPPRRLGVLRKDAVPYGNSLARWERVG